MKILNLEYSDSAGFISRVDGREEYEIRITFSHEDLISIVDALDIAAYRASTDEPFTVVFTCLEGD